MDGKKEKKNFYLSRWGASNSLNVQALEGEGEISFLSIASEIEALESIENQ